MRSALVTALVSSADSPYKSTARRFVQGLSSDELQFIASFLGACVLDCSGKPCTSRTQWAERIAWYQHAGAACPCSPDEDHKMILLLEFLCRSGGSPIALSAQA